MRLFSGSVWCACNADTFTMTQWSRCDTERDTDFCLHMRCDFMIEWSRYRAAEMWMENTRMLCIHQASAWTVALRMTRECLADAHSTFGVVQRCAAQVPQRSVLSVKWIAINYGRRVILASRSMKLSFARAPRHWQTKLSRIACREAYEERRPLNWPNGIWRAIRFQFLIYSSKIKIIVKWCMYKCTFFRQHQPVAKRMLW